MSAVAPGVPLVWCTEIDLGNQRGGFIESTSLPEADQARVLVRFHGEPMEFVQVPLVAGRAEVTAVRDLLSTPSLTRLAAHLADDGVDAQWLDGNAESPLVCRRPVDFGMRVSVVVCTRDRGPELRDCLVGLQALSYDDLEILIVDNAPSDDLARRVFETIVGLDNRFRYIREDRPGLSCARNRGLAEASGDIVAYTDDDVRVDKDWVSALVGGFRRRPDVACVTSLVCTSSLQTPAEHYFDGKVSWASSCEPALYDLTTASDDPLYPYASGLFGTGAGMAFRVGTLRELGGFDEALGAGTRTLGGEDLDIFVRVLLAGQALCYEPASLVWHSHRSDLDGLRRQMFGYGSGLTAYVTKHLLDRNSRRALVSRIPRGVVHMTGIARDSQKTTSDGSLPSRSLLIRELAGMAVGPFRYVSARRRLPPAVPAAPLERVA